MDTNICALVTRLNKHCAAGGGLNPLLHIPVMITRGCGEHRDTWEREEPAVHGPGDGLQFDHVHGLSDVHRGRHAAQGAAHKLGHFLHREHLQQLVEDGREGVEQGGLKEESRVRGGERRRRRVETQEEEEVNRLAWLSGVAL